MANFNAHTLDSNTVKFEVKNIAKVNSRGLCRSTNVQRPLGNGLLHTSTLHTHKQGQQFWHQTGGNNDYMRGETGVGGGGGGGGYNDISTGEGID